MRSDLPTSMCICQKVCKKLGVLKVTWSDRLGDIHRGKELLKTTSRKRYGSVETLDTLILLTTHCTSQQLLFLNKALSLKERNESI